MLYPSIQQLTGGEINRECNTIGSKSSDTAFAKLVIEAKSAVEKIREQIQNIE